MTGRWRNGLGWVIVMLVVAGVAAAAITAWLSNSDKGATVVAGLVVAAVVGVVAPQIQQVLGGKRQRRALVARRAAGVIRGRLPRLGDIGLGELGVRAPREASGQPRSQLLYASRHALDPALADAFTKHQFVLVHGPSAAGKSRSCAEAARSLWRRRPVLVPYQQPGALSELMDARIRPQTIVWLDDLDRHLDAGVDAGLVRRLLDVSGVHVIATMRASAYETFKPGILRPVGADVIDLSHQVQFTEWDQQDRDQASSLLASQPGQSDVVAALHRGTGLGSYLSAVPDLIKRLEQGVPPPEGVAVVRTAADWYRSGLARPVPVSWARNLYPVYLPSDDVTLVTRFDDGITWATTPVSGARLLTQPTDGSGLVIHDAVLEYLSTILSPGLPEPTWRAITAELTLHQNLNELTTVGIIAYRVHAAPVIAEHLLKVAADAGHAEAANNLGVLLQQSGRLPEAERWYQAAADAGQPDAANNLGVLLQQSGRLPEAERWYQAAADAGQPDAANNLGLLLQQSGRLPEAERWYQAAADAGHAEAANNLGLLLQQSGRLPEAERWYQAAAEAGHAEAANNLGLLLQQSGRLPEAERWYQAAAEAGHAEAANNLGLLLQQSGRLPEAKRWYQAAAEAGHAYAANNLQVLLRQSRRIERGRASVTLGMINGALRRRVAAGDIPGALAQIQQLAQSADLILAEDVGVQQVMNNVGQAIDVICQGGSPSQLDATAAACEQAATGTPSPLLTATFQALRGTVLAAKLGHTREIADLDAAVRAFEQAVEATPEANPIRAVYAARLAELRSAQVAFAGAPRDEEPQDRVRQIAIDGSDPTDQASDPAALDPAQDPSRPDRPGAG